MTPAAALLDRLLDIVVTTELDQPGRISLASGLMDVTRARDGLLSHASSHGFGAAMTDDDTNEETARPPPNDALPAI
jgi:hypothetical protein